MSQQSFVEIIEFTDPASIWCWGSEPILRKLETFYKDNIKISYVMGGLIKDIRHFHDEDIREDVAKNNEKVACKWLKASERHGMPVQIKGVRLFEGRASTYPMNIAFKAAQFQDEKLAKRFLRRMREASAVEARKANQVEVLVELAKESGLNIQKFKEKFYDGSAERALAEDLKLVARYRIHSLPSFLITNRKGRNIRLRGYHSYAVFREILSDLTEGTLLEKSLEGTREQVLAFIRKFERVALTEIEQVFNLSYAKIENILSDLLDRKQINILYFGNIRFITARPF